jgi:hypothetical protein
LKYTMVRNGMAFRRTAVQPFRRYNIQTLPILSRIPHVFFPELDSFATGLGSKVVNCSFSLEGETLEELTEAKSSWIRNFAQPITLPTYINRPSQTSPIILCLCSACCRCGCSTLETASSFRVVANGSRASIIVLSPTFAGVYFAKAAEAFVRARLQNLTSTIAAWSERNLKSCVRAFKNIA